MMKLVGHFLDGIGILDKDRFLDNYTTTIGSVVYVPFKIGVTSDKHSLLSQMSTCIHEHQHIAQWQRDGLVFMLEYLTDSTRRAVYEVEAMNSSLEFWWWYSRTLPSINQMALKLTDYNCSHNDIILAERMLRTIAKTVRKGAVVTSAGKTAISYLQKHCV